MKEKITTNHFEKLRVLGVGGSPRAGGNSDALVRQILQGVREKDIATEAIHLRDYSFEPCIGCEKCRKDEICTGLNDGMHLIYPKIVESQGLVLISPTHNYNITAWVKAFIDRLYCFYTYDNNRPRGWTSRLNGQGRKAVIAAVCEQETKKDMGMTLEAMRLPLEALGYEIIDELPVFGLFDKGAVKKEEKIMAKARAVGLNLASSLLT
ncbi:MAG: flavodoxin family protein [Deltaproteobacteria bacterium]|nr:flavodoxin family protein [Deltaproteobacteria bacterium]MBN2846247.1 flavodoxin family protein [Deltaproteobacteria bacterium]